MLGFVIGFGARCCKLCCDRQIRAEWGSSQTLNPQCNLDTTFTRPTSRQSIVRRLMHSVSRGYSPKRNAEVRSGVFSYVPLYRRVSGLWVMAEGMQVEDHRVEAHEFWVIQR